MYTYSDYFDTKKKKKPYALPGDDLKDCLNALDMLLEAFMFFKADMRQEGCFHARGIEVKEDEIGTYFKTAPAERAKENAEKAKERIERNKDQQAKALKNNHEKNKRYTIHNLYGPYLIYMYAEKGKVIICL